MRAQVVVVLALAALPVFAGESARLAAQVPQPFPRPQTPARPAPSAPPPATTTPPPAPAAAPTAGPPDESAPSEMSLGFPLYPNSQFITSYDAGKGQRYYLFGSSASFPELVKYYQT